MEFICKDGHTEKECTCEFWENSSVMSEEILFGVFDTEDNSPLMMRTPGKTGFDKWMVQCAARVSNGEEFYRSCPTVDDAIKCRDAFKRWLRSFKTPLQMYAHNLQYDLGNLWGDELDELDLSLVGGRLIRARYRNVTFLNSMNIWPMPLKKVGEAFGLVKGELDEESREYLDMDVEITYRAMEYARNFAAGYDVRLPATLGGLAVQVWHSLGGGNWQDADMFCRDAYKGGRVELFHTGGTGHILYTDINSLYPSVMTQMFPTTSEPTKDIEGWGVAEVVIDVPEDTFIAPLPVTDSGGAVVYPVGRLCGTWTFHEIRNAIEHGATLQRIVKATGSKKGEHYYRDFVLELYALRKASKDEAHKLMLKLLMNNLYGQLGMRGEITRSLWLDDVRPETDGVVYGRKMLVDTEIPLPIHANYLHAAYVTSYARLKLQEYLRLVGENVIYCDTDSVFFWAENYIAPFPISNELGEMKLEAEATEVHTYAPKVYQIGNEYKAKGIRRELAKQFIENGSVEFDAPHNLREAIQFYDRGNSRKLSVWRKVKKSKQTEYSRKRLVNGQYWPKKVDMTTGEI